ncbi:hypothetical protein Salat_2714500 [Sesamum alatum]|uniref:Uncharacterized protein n=1 Tax=Sesamum alatum TaxID=300844 RepID=A0AAE1XR82_9LAMI|nr:hypothetical protein Salat_2714500 [Sesamum alatum]
MNPREPLRCGAILPITSCFVTTYVVAPLFRGLLAFMREATLANIRPFLPYRSLGMCGGLSKNPNRVPALKAPYSSGLMSLRNPHWALCPLGLHIFEWLFLVFWAYGAFEIEFLV